MQEFEIRRCACFNGGHARVRRKETIVRRRSPSTIMQGEKLS
jgi:hypothetical protein